MTDGHQIRGVKTVTLYTVTNSSLIIRICKCNKAEYLIIFVKVVVPVYSPGFYLPKTATRKGYFRG